MSASSVCTRLLCTHASTLILIVIKLVAQPANLLTKLAVWLSHRLNQTKGPLDIDKVREMPSHDANLVVSLESTRLLVSLCVLNKTKHRPIDRRSSES